MASATLFSSTKSNTLRVIFNTLFSSRNGNLLKPPQDIIMSRVVRSMPPEFWLLENSMDFLIWSRSVRHVCGSLSSHE